MQWLRPLLCLQSQDSKIGSGLFYHWSLFRNNTMATNHQRFTSSYGECCHFGWFATKSSRFASLSAVKFSSKFLGVRRIFAAFAQTFPKSFCAPFAPKFSPQRTWITVFGVTSKIGPDWVFLQTLGAIFAQIFKDLAPNFQRFCPNFQGFCPNFWQIKTFCIPASCTTVAVSWFSSRKPFVRLNR